MTTEPPKKDEAAAPPVVTAETLIHQTPAVSAATLSQVDKILDIYKRLSYNPSLLYARIISIARNGISINCVWTQRNLERNIRQKFSQIFSLDADLQLLAESFPVEVSTERLTASSENEKLKAILREVTIDGKRKQYIEIWDRQHLLKNYDLEAYDVHGAIYTDNMFSSFQFSPDNKKLMYIAEKKAPKVEPFYVQRPPVIDKPPIKPVAEDENEAEKPIRGGEYVYQPDWGEQLEGKHQSVIVILTIETDHFWPLPFIPEEYFPAETIWTPNGYYIVGVAYKRENRYLGRYGCSNRESFIFLLKGTEFRIFTKAGLACKTPQFSPNGRNLIWLERDCDKPHHNVQRLMRIKWEVVEIPDMIVDLVKTNITIANDKKFYGFYGQTIPKRCWSQDSNYLFLSTPQRTNVKSYVVDLEKKTVHEINNPDGSSLKILDVRRNRVVFSKFSTIQPPQLVVGKFEPGAENIGNIPLVNCTGPLDIPNKENLYYDNNEFEYQNDDPIKDFNFTYFGLKQAPEKSMPLIVVPHGGPHYSFSNQFNMDHAVFAVLGFGILQVNFRGSSGMGGDSIEFLSGRIGDTDIVDCVNAVKAALAKYPQIDPEKVNLYGAGHGAFVCAHLSAQYPDMFRAVVMRAPVVDIYSMFTSTDTPDWCPANTNCLFLEKLPPASSQIMYTEVVLKMFDRSPIRHIDHVKAPTLVAVGTKDLRTPASQGRLWYNRLLANNVSAKLYVYEDHHVLTNDLVKLDFLINSALWLIEHSKITLKPLEELVPPLVPAEEPKEELKQDEASKEEIKKEETKKDETKKVDVKKAGTKKK